MRLQPPTHSRAAVNPRLASRLASLTARSILCHSPPCVALMVHLSPDTNRCGEKLQVGVGSALQLVLGIIAMFSLGDWRIALVACMYA